MKEYILLKEKGYTFWRIGAKQGAVLGPGWKRRTLTALPEKDAFAKRICAKMLVHFLAQDRAAAKAKRRKGGT